MNFFLTSLAMVICITASQASAVSITTIEETKTEGYVGLVWTLNNNSAKPDVVIGVRSAQVTSSDFIKNASMKVTGADFSVRFKIDNGVTFDSSRLIYLSGNRDMQANIGLGYSATAGSLLGVVGAQTNFMRVGADYIFQKKSLDGSVELNTLKKVDTISPHIL